MANWSGLALICVLVGLEVDTLGILRYQIGFSSWLDATEALLIIAFLLYVVSAVLIVLSNFTGLSFDLPVAISVIVMMIIAGVFLIAGVGHHRRANEAYSGVLEISASLLGFLVAAFVIIQLVQGGAKTSPSAA